MIANARQILDEQGDARERPESGFVTLSHGAFQQCGGHLWVCLAVSFGLGPAGPLLARAVLPPFFHACFQR